ncbi:MAG: hypothetical protein U0930_06030 [Pirellulales bacterium]
MVWLLSESQIDRVVVRGRVLILVGLAAMILAFSLPQGIGIGLFSGFMLFSLGIYGLAFRRWRSEPGVWMLAVLLTSILGPCWAYFEVLQIRANLFQPAGRAVNWDQLRLTIDCIVALLIFAYVVKLSVSVAIENWRRTRRSRRI